VARLPVSDRGGVEHSGNRLQWAPLQKEKGDAVRAAQNHGRGAVPGDSGHEAQQGGIGERNASKIDVNHWTRAGCTSLTLWLGRGEFWQARQVVDDGMRDRAQA
jgi:hypothetical protein